MYTHWERGGAPANSHACSSVRDQRGHRSDNSTGAGIFPCELSECNNEIEILKNFAAVFGESPSG